MEVERGSSYKSREPYQSFAERALEEAKDCTPFERGHKFLNVYSEYCTAQSVTDPERGLRLALTGASYVYSQMRRKLTATNALMVFYNKNGKFVPLWELHHFQSGTSYLFLNTEELTTTLKKVFKNVKLTLGELKVKNIPAISWRVETEDGFFYIPWHSGAVIEDSPKFSFTAKELDEMRNVYTLLRFAPHYKAGTYKILCC
ncbi:MAG: hypothetical protein NC218_05280 [Acetobacter sp.]|nr:hypothetical protein [Acetobacter sp.]